MDASNATIAALGVIVLGLAAGCGPRPAAPRAAGPPIYVPITNMILVKAGSFARSKQTVVLSRDYWLGKYEVTQAEFAALTGKNPSNFMGDSNRPVEKVSYVEAVAYCVELTRREGAAGRLPPAYEYRLPTEAEWEFACHAGGTGQFGFGDDPATADTYAWSEENSAGTTHPVGQKAPNAWGFHDLHGNVWEWCRDWFGDLPSGDLLDPQGPANGKFKVFKGGGWNHAAKFGRISSRFMMPMSNAIDFVGFRVALGPELKAAP